MLGEYKHDFYAGMPAVTENCFGKGKAYYAAFRNDSDFADDFCNKLIGKIGISPDSGISAENGVLIRKRGSHIFVMNFADAEKSVMLDKEYTDIINGGTLCGDVALPVCGYLVLE